MQHARGTHRSTSGKHRMRRTRERVEKIQCGELAEHIIGYCDAASCYSVKFLNGRFPLLCFSQLGTPDKFQRDTTIYVYMFVWARNRECMWVSARVYMCVCVRMHDFICARMCEYVDVCLRIVFFMLISVGLLLVNVFLWLRIYMCPSMKKASDRTMQKTEHNFGKKEKEYLANYFLRSINKLTQRCAIKLIITSLVLLFCVRSLFARPLICCFFQC